MNAYKKYLITIGLVFALGLLGVGFLVVSVDPFMQYHKGKEGFPYIVDDQLSQNPGLARNETYDAVLLGSSVTVNFSGRWFRDAYGVDLLKLPYNGAYPRDIANAMAQVDQGQQNLKTVFLAVDITSYSGETTQTKYPLPAYLYDGNLLNDVSYIYNMDVILSYIVKPYLSPEKATPKEEYYSDYFLYDGLFQKEWVLSHYDRPDISVDEADGAVLLAAIEKNMDENICPIFEKHPDTRFILFFPPRSIIYWDAFQRKSQIDLILANEKYVIDRCLAYDNVEIHYFEDATDIITNLDNYMDQVHYSREICEKLVRALADGSYLLTKENEEEILANFSAYLHAYPYDAIFE